ncbi:hypothetical protein JE943_002381 [Flavobacterium psychrophilum]|nr:hypothetical protein [Flavobacterium psychrophilum]
MNYVDALNYKETVTGHTTMIGKYEHVFLVVPSKKEDFIKYTTDYFTKYKDKTFFDEKVGKNQAFLKRSFLT